MRNRRLLFRSYLTLAGGLLIVAVLLDLGFGYLQTRQQPDTDQWLESTFRLIETRLEQSPETARSSVVAEIAAEIGYNLQLLPRDAVAFDDIAEHGTSPLVDEAGTTSYLQYLESIDAVIRLGPIAESGEGWLLNLLPPLFYLSILLIVGVWLRPLLRDINLISDAAQRFAADYREPITTADEATELTSLAGNLDDMAARLSGVLRSQKELIAALSHEMRTPLARIRFALAVCSEGADARLRDKLAAMNFDVQEIDELIASMLNYARLDHPETRMNWQSVPARAWIERLIGKMPGGDIRFGIDLNDSDALVRMDSHLMELALSNLLMNALRYAKGHIRCALTTEAGNYCLTVDDDGPGIPEEARDEIFRAFSRIDDSRSRETGGSGLGLAVVARVAELHGGSASIETAPDLGGARFVLRWPVHICWPVPV